MKKKYWSITWLQSIFKVFSFSFSFSFSSSSSSSSTGLAPTQVGSPVRTHLFHFLWSCASASSISAAFRSSLMQSFHLLLGLPLFLFPTSIAITLLPTYPFSRLTTWPNHLNLPSLIFTPSCYLVQSSNPTFKSRHPHFCNFQLLHPLRHRQSLRAVQHCRPDHHLVQCQPNIIIDGQ